MVLQITTDSQKLTSHDIQRDIVCAGAIKTRNAIVNNLGDEYFAILLDVSQDVSTKE